MTMRTLELTHEEVELVKRALGYVYNTRLDILNKNKYVLDQDAIDGILKTANKYEDLNCAISGGEKDI